MNKPMIEQNDRGITINKTLGWAMLVGLLTGGIWIGTQVTTAKEGVESLKTREEENRMGIATNREAISALRSSNARVDQRLTGIEQTAQRTEATVAEILRYLRNGARP